METKDKFNGWYCYGEFPNMTVKTNFIEEFLSDYYPELNTNKCYFMVITKGRKSEYGIIGNGCYVPIPNCDRVENFRELSDRLLYTDTKFSIMPNNKSYEEFESLVLNILENN